jgi:hypothetical protein
MRRLMIHLVNWALLIIVLIGIPSITSKQFGGLAVSSVSKWQMLTLWGLGLIAAGNLLLVLFAKPKRRIRNLLLVWSIVFSAILVFEILLFAEVIHFEWLKDLLVGLSEKVRGGA